MTHLVYLSESGVRVMQRCRSRNVVIGQADIETAIVLLSEIPAGSVVRLVVDSADDVYQIQQLPHVRGRTRQLMLQRHARTLLMNQIYTAVHRQTRLKDGRRDDVYLFAAIQAHEWLRDYLQALQHVQILTMTSAAILVQQLAQEQDKQATALWVTQDQAGVRLSFVAHGQLRFTRLLNHELDVLQEIGNTQQYLMRHQLLALAVLPVYYPAKLFQPEETAQNCWIQQTDDYLAVLARSRHVLNFASREMRQKYQRAQLQRWLRAIALVVIMLGSVFAGYLYQQHQRLSQQLQTLLHTRIPVVAAVDVVEKKSAVVLAQQIAQRADPMTDLTWLSQLLEQHAQIQIRHVQWRSNGVLAVDGMVPGASSETAMRDVDAFVQALRHERRVQTVVTQHMPVDTDPHVVMHGGVVHDDATFSLQINLRDRR
jgi:hypothetical protein